MDLPSSIKVSSSNYRSDWTLCFEIWASIIHSLAQEEIPNIVDCPDPDHMTPHERRVARIAHEEVTFENCQDHYLCVSQSPFLPFPPHWCVCIGCPCQS